jgi:hypothetical protein
MVLFPYRLFTILPELFCSSIIILMKANPQDFDKTTPVDEAFGEKTFLNKTTYLKILGRFESQIFLKNMQTICDHVNSLDFKKMFDEVHSLKGSASYCAAGRIFEDCFSIQAAYERKDFKEMLVLYPNLLYHAVEFRVHWRRITEGERYVLDPEHETIASAKGYEVVKDGDGYKTVVSPEQEALVEEAAYLRPKEESLGEEAKQPKKTEHPEKKESVHSQFDSRNKKDLTIIREEINESPTGKTGVFTNTINANIAEESVRKPLEPEEAVAPAHEARTQKSPPKKVSTKPDIGFSDAVQIVEKQMEVKKEKKKRKKPAPIRIDSSEES